MTEEKEKLEDKEKLESLLLIHGQILYELMEFPRFKMFLAANYEIEHKDGELTVSEYSNEHAKELLKKAIDAEKAVEVILPTRSQVSKFK